MTSPIYLALGTNLGDREANLQAAREALSSRVRLIRASSIYVTPPWGYIDQPEFLNQVVEVDTVLKPLPLLHFLKDSEAKMGREATFHNGPRLIDLDILFYGQAVMDGRILTVPHPRLQDRAFVLVPLDEIAPDFVHPALHKTVHELLAAVDREGIRRL
jgi:2-amino-4-hydroxy-6-hydroxymethyldihydropteridine diphosphokinase